MEKLTVANLANTTYYFSHSQSVLSMNKKHTKLYCMSVFAPGTICKMSHLLAELQPATWRPGAAPLTAAGRAVEVRPAKRPSSHSGQRALRRPAACPPGWSRSAGLGSSESLIHKFTGLSDSRIKSIQECEVKLTNKRCDEYLGTYGSSEYEPLQLVSPLQTHSCIPLLPPDSWAEKRVTDAYTVHRLWNLNSQYLLSLYTHIHIYTHLSTASLMSLIQVFRSSLDDVWTSYISGPAADALIKNIPLSSFATSRTINFCRAMTGGFWSWRKSAGK